MAQLLEYFKMALDNIRANKGRSILTMLGVIIGISSVIMIMSIGQGAKAEIGDHLLHLYTFAYGIRQNAFQSVSGIKLDTALIGNQ